MSRDYTLFQFDVDEATLRRVLSSIPGVTPVPPDERQAAEDGSVRPGTETTTATDDAGAERTPGDSPTGARSGVTDETPGESAGVEAHLDDSTAMSERQATATRWTAPSTPWPGAPVDEDEEGGLLDRLRDRWKLLVGGLAVILGVVVGAVAWFLKKRDNGDDSVRAVDDRPARGRPRGPGEVGKRSDRPDRPDRREREPPADDSQSRSYPVDAAPVIGIAFLAVGTVILRRVHAGSDD